MITRLIDSVASRIAGRPRRRVPRFAARRTAVDPRPAPLLLTRVIFIALFAGVVAIGCGDNSGPRRENLPPTARITSGPVEGDTTSFKVRLSWTGEDRDGHVAAYEFAVDPPMDLASAAWERTTDFSRLFAFATPEAESVRAGSSVTPTGLYHGMHAVFVRAVDNEGAVSEPAHIALTARSVAPVTMITRPNVEDDILTLGASITVDWDGTDTDPAGAGPLRYEYALVNLSAIVPPISLLQIYDPRTLQNLLMRHATWVPADPDSLPLRLPLALRAQYIFGVRAINAAGAAEPFFDFGRNAFKFQTFDKAGVPVLTISSELGNYTYSGPGSPMEVEAVTGMELRFTVSANADSYGEEIAGWRWGVDLADLESEAGWSPWTTNPVLPPIEFPHAGIHTLYVEVRDVAGGMTRGTLILRVLAAPMDRPVLWVDDSRDTSIPNDTQHDAFWYALFQDSGRFDMATEFFKYEVHGTNDTYSQNPIAPTLEQMLRYRSLVWECNVFSGYNGKSGLLSSASLSRRLGVYLLTGGQLWVDGTMTVAAMLPSPSEIHADFIYPKDVTAWRASFAYRYMKLASTKIMNAKGVPSTNNLIGVRPFPGRAEVYPLMDQDPGKIDPFKASVSHCDAIFDPIYLAAAGLTGVLDSLYVYQAKSLTSAYQNKLNAVRWHDPDPARGQGRTQWFGFPLYYMKKDQAQETFNRSIDWFREERLP